MRKADISEALRRDALVIQKEKGTLAAAIFMQSWYFPLSDALKTLTEPQLEGERNAAIPRVC